jgi:16S rRNA (uracil1498-N3)-methyltransferase
VNLVLFFPYELASSTLPACDGRVKHIKSVLKLSSGRTFQAGVLNQSLGLATIQTLTSTHLSFTYQPLTPSTPRLPIHMLIGATRPPVMRRILKDMTTLGAAKITILHTKNSEKSYLESSLWQNDTYKLALYEGLEQAKSVLMPTVERAFSLPNWLKNQPLTDCHLVLEANSSSQWQNIAQTNKSLTLAIGPERGFTLDEMSLLAEAGFTPISMGATILRTETSCSVAFALAAHALRLW